MTGYVILLTPASVRMVYASRPVATARHAVTAAYYRFIDCESSLARCSFASTDTLTSLFPTRTLTSVIHNDWPRTSALLTMFGHSYSAAFLSVYEGKVLNGGGRSSLSFGDGFFGERFAADHRLHPSWCVRKLFGLQSFLCSDSILLQSPFKLLVPLRYTPHVCASACCTGETQVAWLPHI